MKKKENAQYSARTLSQYYLNDFMGHGAFKRQATDAWDGLSKYKKLNNINVIGKAYILLLHIYKVLQCLTQY